MSEKKRIPDRRIFKKARQSAPTPLGRHARNSFVTAASNVAKRFFRIQLEFGCATILASCGFAHR
jgi:hypothetical protein